MNHKALAKDVHLEDAIKFCAASNRHGAQVDADSIVESAIKGGKLSLRRVVNALQSACM